MCSASLVRAYGVSLYILRDWFQYAAISETPYPVHHKCVRVRSRNQSGKTTKMANFKSMCSFFRINCVLRIEIDQIEEKLNFIKEVEWLNLSVERLTDDYKYKIATKKAQITDNQAAASNIVAAAMQQ